MAGHACGPSYRIGWAGCGTDCHKGLGGPGGGCRIGGDRDGLAGQVIRAWGGESWPGKSQRNGMASYVEAWLVIPAGCGAARSGTSHWCGPERTGLSKRTGLLSAGVASRVGSVWTGQGWVVKSGRAELECAGVASHSGMAGYGLVRHQGAESGELSRLGQARHMGTEWLDAMRPVIPDWFGVARYVPMI